MQIEILAAESMGVRGLCCVVKTNKRRIVIDPGVALGFRRHKLLPHPVQVAASEETKEKIKKALEGATDVVISHYHGDHAPLVDANPYQLPLESVAKSLMSSRLWLKGISDLTPTQAQRAKALVKRLDFGFTSAEGMVDSGLTFSMPVPHGRAKTGVNVMMTRIEDESNVFIHASDIQMLNDEAIERILMWQPRVVLASGPPIYLPGLSLEEQRKALQRVLLLASNVRLLILDHHLMRSKKGEQWLDYVSSLIEGKVICAADFMGCRRSLLEAERAIWYRKVPVSEGWHDAYAQGKVNTRIYLTTSNINLILKG